MKTIRVSAAIIFNDKNEILIAERGYGDYKGYWEFPGGKRQEGESGEDAAIREIWEELEMDIKVDSFFSTIEYDYPTFHLTMDSYLAHSKSDNINVKEHLAIKWSNIEELDDINWLPADVLVVEELKKRIYSKGML